MPRFVAVYTMKPEDLAAFRTQAKSEQDATDKLGLKAWKEWSERNAAAIVATDLMVGKTKRVTKSGIADARNQIAGFLILGAADFAAAAGLFQDHPHITVFPGDGIDVMPVVTGPRFRTPDPRSPGSGRRVRGGGRGNPHADAGDRPPSRRQPDHLRQCRFS